MAEHVEPAPTRTAAARPHLARLDLPTLLVQPDADNGVFPSQAEEIFAGIAATDKEFVTLPGDHYFAGDPSPAARRRRPHRRMVGRSRRQTILTRIVAGNGGLMDGIAGRIALVTGAARASSIGRATALRLAAEGAKVACLDVGQRPDHAPDHGVGSLAELDETVALIRERGGEAIAICADVTNVDEIEGAVERVRANSARSRCVARSSGASGSATE